LKINEHIKRLDSAKEAIESAPQKGFINLDLVSNILQDAKLFLEDLSPHLELGEKLAEDYKSSMLKKLQTLKTAGGGVLISRTEDAIMAGGGVLISRTEDAIMTGSLDYTQLKSVNTEIDSALEIIFGGHTKSLNSNAGLKQNYTQKHEDYH